MSIQESIWEYIKRPNTDYAVMIEGEWGRGKSTYYRHYVHDKLRETSGYTSLFISLYGLTSIEDLSKGILAERWVPEAIKSFSNSNTGRISSQLGSALLTTAVANIPPQFRIVQIPKLKLDPAKILTFNENTVLCFDDLERTKLDREQLFGFVNGFVERDHLKVIFIGNEQDVAITTDERYRNIKEKVIRFTLKFPSQVIDALREFINNTIQDGKLRQFLLDRYAELLRTFDGNRLDNLRHWKHALEILETSFKSIKDQTDLSDDDLWNLCTFTIAAVFEHRSGRDGVKEILKNSTNDEDLKVAFISYARRSNTVRGEEEKIMPDMQFIETYFPSGAGFKYWKSVANYICTGILEREQLCQEATVLSRRPPLEERIFQEPAYSFSDEDFQNGLQLALTNARDGKYPLQKYLYIFPSLVYFQSRGLVGMSIDEIHQLLMGGVELAAEHSEYVQSDVVNHYLSINSGNLSGDDREMYEELVDKVNSLNNALQQPHIKSLAADATTLMNDDFLGFCRTLIDYSHPAMTYPILAGMGPEVLAARIKTCTNSDLAMFHEVLRNRYKHAEVRHTLSDEFEVLGQLSDLLKPLAEKPADGARTVSSMYVDDLVQEIGELLRHVEERRGDTSALPE